MINDKALCRYCHAEFDQESDFEILFHWRSKCKETFVRSWMDGMRINGIPEPYIYFTHDEMLSDLKKLYTCAEEANKDGWEIVKVNYDMDEAMMGIPSDIHCEGGDTGYRIHDKFIFMKGMTRERYNRNKELADKEFVRRKAKEGFDNLGELHKNDALAWHWWKRAFDYAALSFKK